MKRILAGAGLVILAFLVAVPGVGLFYESGAGTRCTSCHEMIRPYNLWHNSSHRETNCASCHGGALTTDVSFHWTNATRAYVHVMGKVPERTLLRNEGALAMVERCRSCHRQEFAQWESGPHSASYKRIFTDQTHNTNRLLMDDCLRCHGMHYEGGIRDLVSPLDRNGPWALKQPELADRPAMPCQACHGIHRQGSPLQKTGVEGRVPGPSQEISRPSLAFFDRRTQDHIPVSELPLPAMLEGGRAVKMSTDKRQALCYQCHAAEASRQVGSGDDRTAIGVHEGISCLSCHSTHGEKTRASCAACHPKMSNCGLDVEKMDTTFLSSASKNNIHWVKCADCHPKGVPQKTQSAQR